MFTLFSFTILFTFLLKLQLEFDSLCLLTALPWPRVAWQLCWRQRSEEALIGFRWLFNTLVPGRWYRNVFKNAIYKHIFMIDILSLSHKISYKPWSVDVNNGNSILVQAMAWCHQTPKHYPDWSWPRSMKPYGIRGPQRVKLGFTPVIKGCYMHRLGVKLWISFTVKSNLPQPIMVNCMLHNHKKIKTYGSIRITHLKVCMQIPWNASSGNGPKVMDIFI